jgi:hypothetical protein
MRDLKKKRSSANFFFPGKSGKVHAAWSLPDLHIQIPVHGVLDL